MPIPSFTLSRRLGHKLCLILLGAIVLVSGVSRMIFPGRTSDVSTSISMGPFPDPVAKIPTATATEEQTAVFAGGCFWGMEAVFEHLKGVSDVVSGFSGGSAATAHYEVVSSGQTGHAESIKITYDSSQISYGQLLKIYFSVAHDPTQLDRQGPDWGTQYRSVIFFANDQQKQVAQAYIEQLNKSHIFRKLIVTQLAPLNQFYPAEEYHQNFIDHNPDYPYVGVNDLLKLEQLQKQFPGMYKN